MKNAVSVLLLVILLGSCSYIQKQNVSQTDDNFGEYISDLHIEMQSESDEDNSIFEEYGFFFPLAVQDSSDFMKIRDDKIILPYTAATLIIDYPLQNPAQIDITSNTTGFTGRQLVMTICENYRRIYAEEEATIKSKPEKSDSQRKLINRATTDGKYGIWGHDLDDLVLSGIEVYKNQEGKIYLLLSIES